MKSVSAKICEGRTENGRGSWQLGRFIPAAGVARLRRFEDRATVVDVDSYENCSDENASETTDDGVKTMVEEEGTFLDFSELFLVKHISSEDCLQDVFRPQVMSHPVLSFQ